MKDLRWLASFFTVAAALIWDSQGAPYFGSEIGPFKTHAHDVEGQVYAVDDRTLFIKGFSYDGQGPDAYFWAGSSSKPDTSGFIIPDENGKKTPLGVYRKNDVLLRLPAGKTLKNIKWISVWCRKFNANFGEVPIPKSLLVPQPVEIGRLPTLEHGVSSGPVVVIDTQTLLVPEFTYDGKGPAAYFWVSRGARQHPRGVRLADENGSFSPLAKYTGKTVVITLPPEHTVHDFDWFGVWCEEARADFGSVAMPQQIVVPPSPRTLGIELEYKLNCEVLRDDLGYEIRWIMDGEDIVMQLVAKLEPGEYMSFGLSKNDSKSEMEKADAIVAWMDKKKKGHAVDYYLGSKEQCVGERGSCPDSKLPDGRNGVTLLNAATINGYTMITVKRPQVGMDEKYDQHVYSDGPQAVVWAVGNLNDKKEVSYHGALRSEGDVYIDFARSPTWSCPQPADPETVPETTTQIPTKKPTTKRPTRRPATIAPTSTSTTRGGSLNSLRRVRTQSSGNRYTSRVGPSESKVVETKWRVPPIVCPSDRTFRAQIGPTGGNKGFKSITGTTGWGIAWYMNGMLIPEITVERGKSYTFIVEGGDDPENPARTHPLYITDDPVGGFEHKSVAEKKKVKIFAGAIEEGRGRFKPIGKGRLCEWKLPTDMNPDDFVSFEDFQENLELKCDRGKPGRFSFKPDKRTPDVLYYQCYTHRHLGWKINVVDSCAEETRNLHLAASIQQIKNVTYNSLASDFKPGKRVEEELTNDGIALELDEMQKHRHYSPSTSLPESTFKHSSSISKHYTDALHKKQYFVTTKSPVTTKYKPHTTTKVVTMESFHLGDVVYPRNHYFQPKIIVPRTSPKPNTFGYTQQSSRAQQTIHVQPQRPQNVEQNSPQWWHEPSKNLGDRQKAISSLRHKLEVIQGSRNEPQIHHSSKQRIPIPVNNQHQRPPHSHPNGKLQQAGHQHQSSSLSTHQREMIPVLVKSHKEPQVRRIQTNPKKKQQTPKNIAASSVHHPVIVSNRSSSHSDNTRAPTMMNEASNAVYTLHQVLSMINKDPRAIPGVQVFHLNHREARSADHHAGHKGHSNHKDHTPEEHEKYMKKKKAKSSGLSMVVSKYLVVMLSLISCLKIFY